MYWKKNPGDPSRHMPPDWELRDDSGVTQCWIWQDPPYKWNFYGYRQNHVLGDATLTEREAKELAIAKVVDLRMNRKDSDGDG